MLQQGGQIVQGAVEADGVGGHLAGFGDHGGAVARGQGIEQGVKVAAVGGADHLAHVGFSHAAAAHGDGLVEQA